MRTRERMEGLQKWALKYLCEGRIMKSPGKHMDIKDIVRTEPKCFLAWTPGKIDSMGLFKDEPQNVVPGILIMPTRSHGKFVEEKRFDRYNNVHRPSDLGQTLAISMLFAVYEPGIRLPGFVDSVGDKGKGLDPSLVLDGTTEGLFTLTDWMDDCMKQLLHDKSIENTDLFVQEDTISYSLYTDQEYVVDKRPIYYGFVDVTFAAYAEEGSDSTTKNLLL